MGHWSWLMAMIGQAMQWPWPVGRDQDPKGPGNQQSTLRNRSVKSWQSKYKLNILCLFPINLRATLSAAGPTLGKRAVW